MVRCHAKSQAAKRPLQPRVPLELRSSRIYTIQFESVSSLAWMVRPVGRETPFIARASPRAAQWWSATLARCPSATCRWCARARPASTQRRESCCCRAATGCPSTGSACARAPRRACGPSWFPIQ